MRDLVDMVILTSVDVAWRADRHRPRHLMNWGRGARPVADLARVARERSVASSCADGTFLQ